MINKAWWHGKTAYQIYPQSFFDTNGDGIGDLPGVTAKLDYLQTLGVDILWLCPVFLSPGVDNGYDISDYRAIDPRFGTMVDMDRLLAEAKERGMAVLLDLVVNHCSDAHPWFQAAIQDPDGPYGQYFYIEKIGPDGALPCNWRSYFGNSVWSPLPGHPDRVYYHSFHARQPDLNWNTPALRQEIYDMVNWWLDRGLAGFRVDAIMNIQKPPFQDFPPDREDGLCALTEVIARTEGMAQRAQAFSKATFQPHDAFTPAEICHERPCDRAALYGADGAFSSAFDFTATEWNHMPGGWYAYTPMDCEAFKKACFQSQAESENLGFLCNIIENHDQPRGVSHYLPPDVHDDNAKKMLGALSFLLRGIPFLYQGQELGMENLCITDIDAIEDIFARSEYQVAIAAGLTPAGAIAAVGHYARDNARTPFQWSDAPHAGFTTGTPWLAVHPNYREINLARQQEDPDSVWQFYRKLIALRKDPRYAETLVYGVTRPYLPERVGLMAYARVGEKRLLVMGNTQPQPQTVPLPRAVQAVLLSNTENVAIQGTEIALSPWQLVVLEII